MNRIDPKTVANFFATHRHINPTRQSFVVYHPRDEDYENLVGCCGLTSLIIDNQDRDFTLADLYNRGIPLVCPMIAKTIGVPALYAIGFAKGWDNCVFELRSDDASQNGYADGQEAYRLTQEALA